MNTAASPHRVALAAITFASALLLSIPQLRAQTAGSLDPAYIPIVSPSSGLIFASAVQPDGKMIIGGEFSMVGGAAHANIARLNADGSVDASFTASTNSFVYSVVVQTDGKILIGGTFYTVNGEARVNIARLNADGSLDNGFFASTSHQTPQTLQPNVLSIVVQPDGKILIGGGFTEVNGVSRKNIARLNADGSLESAATFNPGSGADDEVVSLAVQEDGKILLGGFFTQVNSAPRNRIARLNADGSLESTATFNPGTGANASVQSIAVQADGKILIGGSFTQVDGNSRNRIARLKADGSLESTATFNAGTGANDSVNGVSVQANGKILLGGDFTQVNTASRNRIARLNNDGSLEDTATFDVGTGADDGVWSVTVQADGKVFLGGFFSIVNGTTRDLIARLYNDAATQTLAALSGAQVQWLRGGAAPEVSAVTFELSTDGGSTWSALGGGTRISGGWQLAGQNLPASGLLRARGRTASGFTNGSSGVVETIAGYTLPAGAVDPTYDPNLGGGYAYAAAAQPDGKTIIVGSFNTVGGSAHARIARLNADGSVDGSFGAGANGTVYCVSVQADGKIVIGGSFTQVNGTPRNKIARLHADGTVEGTATFNPGTGANNDVESVAVQADGKILLGGAFTTINGITRNRIARLNADGSVEGTATFNPGTGANNSVNSVVVQADGKILVGGFFTTMNSITCNRIARLNADGSVEGTATFDVGTGVNGVNGQVYCVAVQADGKILLGGIFSSVNDTTRRHIARLHPDGSLESTTTFNPGAGPINPVFSIVVQTDGKILLGGHFNFFDGMERNGIARLNPNGTLESTATFDNGTGANASVRCVSVQADGKILVGGLFSQINGTTRIGIARLINDVVTTSLSAPNSTLVQWVRGGAGPEVTQVTFELSTNGGISWSSLGAGTRIPGGWQLTGQSLTASGSLRARGRAYGGHGNGSSGLVETIAGFGNDTDGDGLLDAWELTYWLSIAGHGPGDDFDSDGLTELEELAFGLNPTIPDAILQPMAVPEGGFLTITLNKHIGVTYEVQSSGTLLLGEPDSFSPVTTTVITDNAATLKVRDNVPFGTPPARFIRVKVIAAP